MTDFDIIKAKELVENYSKMELLRFSTAGSVDDGKSTLIGRLLYDSKAIFDDQLKAIEYSSKKRGDEYINLALLTDGLKAEREQGITIDVAYRYFHTPKRKFIIADTPGHIQYTRNMVTGASTCDLAIILVDARNGVLEQTVRHSYIASLLGIYHIVVAVNKMDLVGYSQEVFENIKQQYCSIRQKINIKDLHFIPISALHGDNVVNRSDKMPWYNGPSLLELLENIDLVDDINLTDFRFPVQYVIRPISNEYHDYRGYAGMIASGIVSVGDEIVVLPSMLKSKIKSIELYKQSFQKAFAPQSVTLTIEEDIDISRGNIIVHPNNIPKASQELDLMICWFNPVPLKPNGKYILKHTTNEQKCIVKDIHYKVNINTLENTTDNLQIQMNDIAKISVKTAKPIFYDPYIQNRQMGAVILIDEFTNETVAAGMIQ